MHRKLTYEELEQKIRDLEAQHNPVGDNAAVDPSDRTPLQVIIDLLPVMIFAKDREGRFILANKAVAESYNLTVNDLVGNAMLETLDTVSLSPGTGRRQWMPSGATATRSI